MKVYKWVETAQEVEIELSSEDVHAIFTEPTASIRDVLYQFNSIAVFLKGLPKATIDELTDGQREVISNFLVESAEKIKPGKGGENGMFLHNG